VRWSYEVGATYTNRLGGDFLLLLRADYGYRSRAASTDNNVAFLPPIEDLSAGVSLTLPGQHWSFSLYGRNLLDKIEYSANGAVPASLGGGTVRTLNEGRVIGVAANFTY